MKGSQPPSRRRFYIGSAAGFWFFVAVVIWGMFFIVLRHEIKGDTWGAWFLASYISAPALLTALLAVLIRNMTRSNVPAWLITPPVFVLVGYIMLRYLFSGGGH
jgi:hypothetical protein